MNIKWNASGYKESFHFVTEYGEDVAELLDVSPGMKLLDLGCGNGALTRKLKDAGAEVFGADASLEMLELARSLHPDIEFLQLDASSFTLKEPVDGIFSNAVFHWIDNQKGLLSSVSAAIKSGGQLVCEFGGRGCAETVHQALAESFQIRGLPYQNPHYFPTIGEYAPQLEDAGLKVIYATLFDRWTKVPGENGVQDWIRMFLKQPFQGISEALAAEIIGEVAEAVRPALYRDGSWYIDYVRIRLKAVKV